MTKHKNLPEKSVNSQSIPKFSRGIDDSKINVSIDRSGEGTPDQIFDNAFLGREKRYSFGRRFGSCTRSFLYFQLI